MFKETDKNKQEGQVAVPMEFVKTYAVQMGALVLALLVWSNCTFVVTETERALILEWNEPVKEVADPGLYFKLPAPFQSIVTIPKQWFMLDANPRSMITADKKTLLVDDFVVARVTDGIKFYQQLKSMPNALTRVDSVSYEAIRNVLARHNLEAVINKERDQVMASATDDTNKGIKGFGMETLLVRITRADLPPENKGSVHQRMNAERNQISAGYRAEGSEQYANKKAETDQEVMTIVAEGEKKAQITMGEGDAEATRIYNAAYGQDPKFFALYRSMDTARRALTNGGKIQFIENGKEPHLAPLFNK